MLTNQQLALIVLQDAGHTREEAALALVNDPEMIGRLGPQIEEKRTALEAQAEQAAQEAFAKTPEGRKQAALQAAQEAEEREKVVSSARVLYAQEFGLSAEGLSDEEVLHATGIERDPARMGAVERDAAVEDFARSLPRMGADERLQTARDLGVEVSTVEGYARDFLGLSFQPTFGDPEGGESA